MRKCKVCGEEFADKFVFCPIDGELLTEAIEFLDSREFNLTLIGDARLSRRLGNELKFVCEQLKLAWPDFKAEPIASTRRELNRLMSGAKRSLARPHVVSGGVNGGLYSRDLDFDCAAFGKATAETI